MTHADQSGSEIPAGQVILEMRDITKEFPGVKALSNVSMIVRRGEIHAICGENGAGKSTLMKVLSGVWPTGSYTGEMFFEGQPVQFSNIRDSEHAGIVIIHQELALIPELSIAENIFLGNEQTSRGVIDWVATQARAKELLARVGLDEDPNTKIKDIGVGKQQLVEIAKALSKNVKLLILDEPTAALNENDSQHLLTIMDGLRSKGVTCIMISHKLNEIEQISDAITIIRDGKSIETLRVKEDGVDENRIIRGMVGRDLESRFPDHTPVIGETFFEVKNWRVQHPTRADRLVCKDSNFFVRRGEIVGFAGLMGAGRTELMRSIFGRSYGTWLGGELIMDGKPLHLKSVSDAIDANIAYVTEDRKTLGLNLLDDIKATTVSAELKQITHNLVVSKIEEYAAAEKFRQELRTKTPTVDEGVAKLSGGNQQKVVVGRWLDTARQLLVAEDPTAGVDVGAKAEIYNLLFEALQTGMGVLVVSTDFEEIANICHRALVFSRGKLVAELSGVELSTESLIQAASAGDVSGPDAGNEAGNEAGGRQANQQDRGQSSHAVH